MNKKVKEPTTFIEQLDKIEKRGCIVENRECALEVLKQINYYRLTAYFLAYKQDDDKYKDGTTFNKMQRTYESLKELRHLLLLIIEEIEIMLRTQLSYYFAHKYKALGYKDENNFNKRHNHQKFLEQIEKDIEANKNGLIVKHHITNYNKEFPIWVIIELFTIGQLSFFFSDMKRQDQKAISKNLYNQTDKNVLNWTKCLTELRNTCAHYSRLYNINLVSMPKTPKGFSYTLKRKVFDYILVLKFLYFDSLNGLAKLTLRF